MKNFTLLSITLGVSRGRNTEGWNICTLTNGRTGKKYVTKGGGYDMKGTVFADYLQDIHQDKLLLLKDRLDMYDGAYGLEGMISIAEACGLEIWPNYIKGKLTAIAVLENTPS